MFIASQKRKENVAEYLLYMWQIEDIIRANDLDIDKIKANVIDHYDLDSERRKQLVEWYESLIDMMRREGVEHSGHLQINKNMIIQLVDLHNALLKDPRFGKYTQAFYASLPYIVELRSKSGGEAKGEVETCFNALYGMLMLRLSSKKVTPETQEAVSKISRFIATLSNYFMRNEKEDIFKDDALTE